MEHAEIINRLGGAAKVAALLGCDRTRASRWGVEGIPTSRFPQVIEAARKAGLDGVTYEALHQSHPRRRSAA